MKLYRLSLPKILIAFIFILSTFGMFTNVQPSFARTLGDIQEDIENKEKELEELNSELDEMSADIETSKGNLDNIQGEIPRIEAEMEIIEKSLNTNRLVLTELQLQQDLKSLEFEEAEIKQDKMIRASYLSWKTGLDSPTDLMGSAQVKNDVYQSLIISDGHGSLENLVSYLEDLNKDVERLQDELGDLEEMNSSLIAKKDELQRREATLMQRIDDLSKSVLGVKTRQGSVQTQLNDFYSEQQDILNYESQILNQGDGSSGNQTDDDEPVDNGGGEDPIDNGDDPVDGGEDPGDEDNEEPVDQQPENRVYFAGMGRDLYQGHGVGMSQFGALGAALQGWSYEQILKHYYPGTIVAIYQPDRTIKVDGYGTMTMDEYVAGIAEVPTVSCEDIGIAFDPNNIWRCWPKEAIKAQAVAARTYAISRTQNGSSICTSTTCQVYDGSDNMAWAAEETSGMVVLYQGNPIEAVYSSDNNQGWGTANNDTIWSNYAGDGSPRPYLRAAKDNSFAYRTSWSKFNWSTNRYTWSQMDQLLNYVNKNSNLSSSRSFVNGLRSDIGSVKNITFSKDPSGRVSKVIFHGSTGNTRTMAGWLFKSIWNSWVYNEMPTGERDYIYSLTFSSYNP